MLLVRAWLARGISHNHQGRYKVQSAEAPNQEGAAKTGKAEVDAVVACLPDLSGREMCDEVSVNFAFVGSKGARKRMVRASPTSALTVPVHSFSVTSVCFCQPFHKLTSCLYRD